MGGGAGTDGDPAAALAEQVRRAALRDHEKLLAAISAGDEDRAASIAGAHLAATRRSTLESSELITSGVPGPDDRPATINANLVGGIDLTRRSAR
jgi:hypothetical protein